MGLTHALLRGVIWNDRVTLSDLVKCLITQASLVSWQLNDFLAGFRA